MKKIIFLCLTIMFTSVIYSQSVKLFSTYVKPVNGETRFATVLTDNTIWWCDPNIATWTKVMMNNLPSGFEIKLFSAYVKPDGETRYAVV